MRLLANIFSKSKAIAAMLFIGMALCLCSEVSAQNTKSQETKKARLQKEIAVLDQQLKEIANKSTTALSKLTLVRKKISNRKELLTESENEIAAVTLQIEQKQREIDVIQARLDTMSFYYSKLVRGAYKNRDARVWYMYILASDNLAQAYRRFGYLKDLSSTMNTQAAKIKQVKSELEQEQIVLNELKSKAEQARAERLAELNQLQSDESSSESLVSQLKKDRTKIQKDLNSKQKQVDALNKEIERIIREAMGTSGTSTSKKTTTTKKAAAPIDYTLAKEFASNKGKLPWPVDGPVVDHYGQHYHPVYKNVKLPFNNGVTVATGKSASVKAVFDGVVKQIVVMPGYNQCVLVQHGDYFSFYCKLGTVSVKAGDKVKTGQTLGTVDTINGETQLHLQIWSGKTPQNPESWLRPR